DAVRVARELPDVDPDLALEGGAVALENADDLPAVPPELEEAPELGALVAAEDAAADDRLARARLEHPPLGDPHLVVHAERDRLDAADEDVLAAAVARLEEGLHDELGRDERTVLLVALDAVEVADRVVRGDRDLARAVVVRALAQDDEVPRVAARDERL